MRAILALGAASAALFAAGAATAAPSVVIKDAVARVTVIPENRADVKVEFLTTNRDLPLAVSVKGERTVIDGGLDYNRVRNCIIMNSVTSVQVQGVGKVVWENMPQVVVRTPMDARVDAGGAVFGTVGRSDALELASAGCGDWTIGNVKGALKVSQAGSGDTSIGSAGSADVRLAGSGDVSMGAVGGDLNINVAGSGDVSAASVDGDLEAKIAGSGNISVAGGRAGRMKAAIAGSGDIGFEGVAERLEAKVAGSGDIHVAKVTGAVDKSILGSGEVSVGD